MKMYWFWFHLFKRSKKNNGPAGGDGTDGREGHAACNEIRRCYTNRRAQYAEL